MILTATPLRHFKLNWFDVYSRESILLLLLQMRCFIVIAFKLKFVGPNVSKFRRIGDELWYLGTKIYDSLYENRLKRANFLSCSTSGKCKFSKCSKIKFHSPTKLESMLISNLEIINTFITTSNENLQIKKSVRFCAISVSNFLI